MKESSSRGASHGDLPRPTIRRMRWRKWLVWLVPAAALVAAGFYFVDYREDNARIIVIRFPDASGITPGQSTVDHLGVEIGTVASMELSPDHSAALVRVRLHKSAEAFASQGTMFWIERAQVSTAGVSGLTTVVSGPYIDGIPGDGPAAREFTGLAKKPVTDRPGMTFLLQAPKVAHLDRDSVIYFRGIQVGVVQDVELNAQATGVDIHVLIWQRYAPLVRGDTQFWVESGVDISGGLFSGLKLNVESLRAILGGAIAFATPDTKTPEAKAGAAFSLNDEPKKDWLGWAPAIPLGPDTSESGEAPRRIEPTLGKPEGPRK